MRISITLNGNPYAIDVEDKCFTAVKIRLNAKNTLVDDQLGFFSKLSNAALRLCREEISSSGDTVSLKEFASRVEAINKQLLDQLDAIPV